MTRIVAIAVALLALLGIALASAFVTLAPGSGVSDDPASVAPLLEPQGPAPALSPATLGEGWRILVPRLGIDLRLQEGSLERDIERQATPVGAAFHLPSTALPGERGNSYVYAHARQGMFLSLWQARVGDEVTVLRPDGSMLRYRVVEIVPRVAANDFFYVQPTDEERLTLQTSTGPNASDPRFVVITKPVVP